MERYDLLYRLYEEFDTDRLRAYQEFVDLFPPVDSRVALDQWHDASTELDELKGDVSDAFPNVGETFATLASHATRNQAFNALDLYTKHGRGINVLVLDVDETLRSAGNTDNEIPRETLHLLTRFHDRGMPIVICTGQTLENVKGFLIQGLGNELVHSGDISIVYEAGTGVFTPGHGADTKQLLYEGLDDEIREVFRRVRSGVLSDAPEDLRRGCHLQGNEFNVTLKPNFETGSDDARAVIDDALVYLLDLVESSVAGVVGAEEDVAGYARAYYGQTDPEIHDVLAALDERADVGAEAVPEAFRALFERIDVAYYEADAAEVGSLELNKVAGVESAFDVLGIDDPFALVMGDSKSDLRVMQWVDDHDAGIAAAPDHASQHVLDHVTATDRLVFDRGDAAEMLRTAFALTQFADLD
ncbi:MULTISPECIES: HAD family hydrolase [Salinibaculum]|uniref:HAD family hydrolase n=1 Tax=Salinibaculum TaxID=2732368 RepID=UPI0030D15938